MGKIVKAIKIGGEVSTFIGDILDPIIEGIEFLEDFYAFACKYANEHPDETDDVNFVFKFSGQLFSARIDMSKSFSDQKANVEYIMKKTAIRRR